MDDLSLSDEQKEYLAGFAVGSGLAGGAPRGHAGALTGAALKAPTASDDSQPSSGVDRLLIEAHRRTTAAGKKLVNEEIAKGERHPIDRWNELIARAEAKVFPKGIEVFLSKSFGIFYVAPTQNSFMCRMRLPGGAITSAQLAGVADIAEELAGGYAHVTTRANLQLREIPVNGPPEVVMRLSDLGIPTRGSGADNLRNVTSSPTSGFDPQEIVETHSLARAMNYYILNNRDMCHLPRKFNISFDGGGIVTTLADTNDIGFAAVRVAPERATADVPAGVYFRVQLAGITGHQQFASDVGWLIPPNRCIETAAAIIRVFIAHGDRTDRKKARLKYLIDAWGMEKFLQEVKKELPFSPVEWELENCEPPPRAVVGAHLGFHPQSQPNTCYVGVVTPVGFLTAANMRDLASIAARFGKGSLRFTTYQNVLIPHIAESDVEAVKEALLACGLDWRAHSVRAGLVACTGNAGCKFAASDTKRHALAIASHVESVTTLDQPINIHLTGCHNSCAQHYIGDIGLIGAKVKPPVVALSAPGSERPVDDDVEEVEGYHIFLGGGFGDKQGIGREFQTSVPADQVPFVIEKVLQTYMRHRIADEPFVDFSRRLEIGQLRQLCGLGSPESA